MIYRMAFLIVCLLSVSSFCPPVVAKRINQEERFLGNLPVVTDAILFNTTNADSVVSAMPLFPVSNPSNGCVSNLPLQAVSMPVLKYPGYFQVQSQ